MSGQKPSFRVSFLEEQTVQTAHTLFPAQTQYEFENWDGMLLDPPASARTTDVRQTVCASKKRCWIRPSCLWPASPKPSRKAGARNASARICVFSEPTTVDKASYFLPIHSARRRSDTSPSRVCLSWLTRGRPVIADHSLPAVDAIERIEQSKKPSRPISLRLRANSELLAQLKTLQIQFLEENGTFGAVRFDPR